MLLRKLQVATAVVLLTGSGLLAQRDDKRPLNPQVAELGENTWLKLETPRRHPITRSSSPWMAYAPEAGVGILWGCSHSYHHNDVWTYDLGQNVWKERLPTEPSAAADPHVLKRKDGIL